MDSDNGHPDIKSGGLIPKSWLPSRRLVAPIRHGVTRNGIVHHQTMSYKMLKAHGSIM